MAETKMVPAEEVSKHNRPGDCWIVIQDKIWDVTDFAPEHPGGATSMILFIPPQYFGRKS
jgi:L-lactate dehydrogenase (cytochrome)